MSWREEKKAKGDSAHKLWAAVLIAIWNIVRKYQSPINNYICNPCQSSFQDSYKIHISRQ